MSKLKFVLSLIFTISLCYWLHHSHQIGDLRLPPLGKLLAPFTGFWQNAEAKDHPNLPDYTDFDQITAAVEVVYDQRLVPHIFAQNQRDAYFVQGFVTAQHRLWQIDIATRSVSGRLSEVVGPKALERDQLQRRKGMVFAAENALRNWQKHPDSYADLKSYVAGINAYIDQLSPADYPIEFKLMDYEPEPMTELKVALFVKAMAATLCSYERDLEATNALTLWGQETFDYLYPDKNPQQNPIITDIVPSETPQPVTSTTTPTNSIGLIHHRTLPKSSPFLGSNNWAVNGQKTTSGKPILCNDPHLSLTLPSIWFEIQIATPDYKAYGVSLPGMPGIIIGFNENIAWGETNVAQDVLDWYQIQWTDASKDHYLLDGQTVAVKKVVEAYQVKGGATVYDTVRYTTWGPIVYEEAGNSHQDMAMHWLAHLEPPNNDLSTFAELNISKNYLDYTKALTHYHSPPQNFVFASKTGDIGMWVQGLFPIKQKNQGRFVQDGSQSSNDWGGFVPQSENPHVLNPESNFVFSANQRSTDETYPYAYNGNFDDYRGRFLHRQLQQMENITVEDMMALQNSNYSIKAEEALPLLLQSLKMEGLTDLEKRYAQLLQSWNFVFDKEQSAPVLFEAWYTAFYHQTWDEMYTMQDSLEVLFPEDWRTIDLLKNDPNSHFFDIIGTPEQETAKEVVQKTFRQICLEMDTLEKKEGQLEWQSYRKLGIRHLANIPAFSHQQISIGGYKGALNAVSTRTGPSWRMIVELGDPVKAYGIYPGGQSGNPGSVYYDNMIDDWAKGEYYPIQFMQSAKDSKESILTTQRFGR